MPELPEVETIKKGLEKTIIGLTIVDVSILNPKSFEGDPKDVVGKKVTSVWRRGKVLGVDLDDTITLLFHLKMSGQLIFEAESGKRKAKRLTGGHPTKDMVNQMPRPSTRVVFKFEDKSKLYFNDQRKFGWIKVREKGKVLSEKFFDSLGPEPLEEEFTLKIFRANLLKRKKTPIKVAIMDQTVVAGVGNIYASEALFLSKIDPRRKVGSLTDNEFEKLYYGIRESLQNGIEYGGSTKTHFVNLEGNRGYFLDHAFVYDREGNPCSVCKAPIIKIQLGGRGTYYCQNCQK